MDTNTNQPLQSSCAPSFLQHFRSMLLDLLPPPSWGLVLLLIPRPSPWPCPGPVASAQCSPLSPSPFTLYLPPLCFSHHLPISTLSPLSPRWLQQIAVYTESGSARDFCLLKGGFPHHCRQWLTRYGALLWDLFLFFLKKCVSWDNIVINWHFK